MQFIYLFIFYYSFILIILILMGTLHILRYLSLFYALFQSDHKNFPKINGHWWSTFLFILIIVTVSSSFFPFPSSLWCLFYLGSCLFFFTGTCFIDVTEKKIMSVDLPPVKIKQNTYQGIRKRKVIYSIDK